ncbi:hypothetical protein OG21DRAFT_1417057, partial [Imleria badia]
VLEVLDKGKASSVTTLMQTRDKASSQLLFENQAAVFIRNVGGFGGKHTGIQGCSAANVAPKRAPDIVMEEKTQAAPCRLVFHRSLSADYNLLHILPIFANIGGFNKPILHELCFMGITGKHVLKTFGPFRVSREWNQAVQV